MKREREREKEKTEYCDPDSCHVVHARTNPVLSLFRPSSLVWHVLSSALVPLSAFVLPSASRSHPWCVVQALRREKEAVLMQFQQLKDMMMREREKERARLTQLTMDSASARQTLDSRVAQARAC